MIPARHSRRYCGHASKACPLLENQQCLPLPEGGAGGETGPHLRCMRALCHWISRRRTELFISGDHYRCSTYSCRDPAVRAQSIHHGIHCRRCPERGNERAGYRVLPAAQASITVYCMGSPGHPPPIAPEGQRLLHASHSLHFFRSIDITPGISPLRHILSPMRRCFPPGYRSCLYSPFAGVKGSGWTRRKTIWAFPSHRDHWSIPITFPLTCFFNKLNTFLEFPGPTAGFPVRW